MKSPSEDIALILVDEGIGTIGTDIFVSKEHETPDECISLFDTGGFPPESGFRYDYPTIQVRVRGKKGKYQATYNKADDIKAILNGKHNVTKNGTRYVGIWAMGDILSLGYDESDRPLLSVNFRIQRCEAS